ncbi:MAG: hypothetical protein ABII82_05960 [Verrucomicrobiota bacterium]
MPAKLDRPLIDHLASSFPLGQSWQTWTCAEVIRGASTALAAHWAPVDTLGNDGGVYAFALPSQWFQETRTIQLHAPHTHTEKIPFEFTVPPVSGLDGLGVVYVGRTTNLKRRIRLHLSRGKPKDGGQVKFGLINCGLFEGNTDTALCAMREKGRVIYTSLPGRDHCANRDILELSLCARLAPPFNIKSER